MTNSPNYINKKILITGATGFIGKELTNKLIKNSQLDIRILTRKTSSVPEKYYQYSEVVEGEMRDKKSLKKAVENIDVVIHLAAIVSAKAKSNLIEEVNVKGTKNLLTACNESESVSRFVYMSSISVYGFADRSDLTESSKIPERINWAYADSKIKAEKAVLNENPQRNFSAIVLRAGDVIGAQSIWTQSIKDEIVGGYFFVPELNKGIMNYVWIEDLVNALLKTLSQKTLCQNIYNVTAGNVNFNKYICDLCKILNAQCVQLHKNTLKSLIKLKTTLTSKISVTEKSLKYITAERIINSDRFQSETGWSPKNSYSQIMRKLKKQVQQN